MEEQKMSALAQLLEKNWNSRFSELQNYYNKHGDCDMRIMQDKQDPLYRLAQWVSRQRRQYKTKSSFLTDERIHKLNSLGFSWQSPHKRFEEKWNTQFSELQNYYKKHGDCNVRIMQDKQHPLYNLSCWVSLQRNQYKTEAPNLTEERIHKLNSLGFSWRSPYKQGDGKNRINDADLLHDLRRLHKQLGKAISKQDIVKHARYSILTYQRRFGSIPNALLAAGITDKLAEGPLTSKRDADAQMLDDLKRIANLLGRRPTAADITRHGKYSSTSFYVHFGSLSKAIKKAGLECMIDRNHEDYHERWVLK